MNLITDQYRQLNLQLHESSMGFGGSGHKWAPRVQFLADELGAVTILDYGCGKGTLQRALSELDIREYDPGILGKDALPQPADLVVCTDVLEHVEPQCLDAVIEHVLSLSKKACLIAVACRPGKRPMADGSMEHRTIQDQKWWKLKLREHARFRETSALRSKEYAAVFRR
jgi:2-polyprenyl-3-methyl-5-hydroxy-6-metoxy-1,4-benzoquinol methylase